MLILRLDKGVTRFQKVAIAACVALVVLIFVGAIVRASGAGMGCPDWPTCWGCLIPPTRAADIDPAKLDIEKFQRKAAQYGIPPESITRESVIASFNPVHTWTEYINRLTSLPLSVLTLVTFVMSLWQWKKRPSVTIAAFLALVLLGVNAWMGAQIVYSGLKPGVITIHMALAILMLCVLVFVAWRGCDKPWKLPEQAVSKGLGKLGFLLLILVLAEGVLGSQIREKTDALKKTHHDAPRSEWVEELEESPAYLVHRSGSWAVLLAAGIFYLSSPRAWSAKGKLEGVVFGTVVAQMILGLVLSQVGILPFAQVLHIGLSTILVAALLLWLLGWLGRSMRYQNSA
ncbi:MAG: heme A synthase [Akkermansiaceae bacterium]